MLVIYFSTCQIQGKQARAQEVQVHTSKLFYSAETSKIQQTSSS